MNRRLKYADHCRDRRSHCFPCWNGGHDDGAGLQWTWKAYLAVGAEGDRPRPRDAVVRITTSTICGTDPHILKGDLPSVTPGRILGHEGIGVVEAVGPLVSAFHVGDRVLISCVSACGICEQC